MKTSKVPEETFSDGTVTISVREYDDLRRKVETLKKAGKNGNFLEIIGNNYENGIYNQSHYIAHTKDVVLGKLTQEIERLAALLSEAQRLRGEAESALQAMKEAKDKK
jgi:hypothetical protein